MQMTGTDVCYGWTQALREYSRRAKKALSGRRDCYVAWVELRLVLAAAHKAHDEEEENATFEWRTLGLTIDQTTAVVQRLEEIVNASAGIRP